MITAILASENMATMGMRTGFSVLTYVGSGLVNNVFTINEQCSYN